jgi:type I restriction enzyme M protein
MFVQSVELRKGSRHRQWQRRKSKGGCQYLRSGVNHTTWRLAKMNLAIPQIENNLGKEHARPPSTATCTPTSKRILSLPNPP